MLGAVSIGMVVYSQWLTSRDFEENATLILLTQTVQQEIATAHLWFEEALGGDTFVDLEVDVHQRIRSAAGLIAGGLEGGETPLGLMDPPESIRGSMLELQQSVLLFDRLVDSRWAGRDSTGVIGGEEDQAFDNVFHTILELSSTIASQVDVFVTSDRQKIFAINAGMMVILASLFTALTALIVWNRREMDARAAVLEHLVRERTASLSASEAEARQRSKDLAVARDEARAANEAKSRFLANMSHEIRTPMNGVVGMTSLLMRTELSSAQQEYVETMHSSGLSLLRIINEVLDFSKIEVGKVTLEDTVLSLESAIDDVLHLFSAEAERNKLTLTSSIDPRIPAELRGDSVRLGQILANLISNAIKFSDSGEIKIAGQLADGDPQTDDDIEVLFEVSDPGIGIAQENLDTLFEHFSQVDESSTRQHAGTGLGLAICKELTLLMRGRIGVRSTLGEGSTFWFTARFDTGEKSLTSPSEAQAMGVDGRIAGHGQRSVARSGRWATLEGKVLIVDDNEVNLLVAQRMLEELGFNVDSATSGKEAIDAAAACDYAAILIDNQMPGMDGNDATRIIRRAEGNAKHTPIVALTANAMASDRARAFAAGVDDYLSKPVFLEDLEGSLLRLLPDDKDAPVEVIAADLRQTNVTGDAVFDEMIVEELRSVGALGEPDLFSELATQVVGQMPSWLSEIKFAAARGDIKSVRRQAHKLRGMCRQIGAERMASVCNDLESTGSASQPAEVLDGVENLRREFDSMYRELRNHYLR